MAGERRESDFMNKSLDEIAAEMDSSLYEREDRDGHHRPQHRYSPYPAEHVPSWRAEKEGNGAGTASGGESGGEVNKVFVANLNYTVTWQKLKDLMKNAGPVIKCDLFKNVDGSSRGMGLVMFADSESAERAVRELNGAELDGRKIFLRKDMRVEDREKAGIVASNPKPRPPPNPSATVFVANLDYSLTWQKLRDVFKVAGKILHVDMLVDSEGQPKGCASVQYETTDEALNSIILFHGQLLQNRPMVVRMDSKSSFQPDPIQLKLQVGKGGMVNTSLRSGPPVVAGGGPGILSSLPAPLAGVSGGLTGSIPLSPTLGTLAQALNTTALSPTALTSQLPLLAALGLNALSNMHHFSSDQLALLGLNSNQLQAGLGVGGGGGRGVSGGVGSSASTTSLLGQRGLLPPVPEHGQEGLLSQLPFSHFDPQDKEGPPSSFSGLMAPRPPPPTSTTPYSSTMAINLSLATALATPNTSLSRETAGDSGRRGKKLFVRNLNFGTSWQALKDYLKAGTGPISYVDVLKNADGRSRGSAIVVFESEDDAEKAIRMYDQSELDGRRISVTFDRSN